MTDWTPTIVSEACEEPDARYEWGAALAEQIAGYLRAAGWAQDGDDRGVWLDPTKESLAPGRAQLLSGALMLQLFRDRVPQAGLAS